MEEFDLERTIEELQAGISTEKNFRLLFDRFWPALDRFFARCGIAQEERGDFTQETFLRIYSGIGGFRREARFERGEATTLDRLATALVELGRRPEAFAAYREAETILRRVGDRLGLAHTLANLGSLHESWGHPDRALSYFQEALPLLEEVGDRVAEAAALAGRARAQRARGGLEAARATLERALEILESQSRTSDRLTEPQQLTVCQVQRELLDEETALLFFTEPPAAVTERGDSSSSDPKDEPKVGRSAERIERPASQEAGERPPHAARQRGEGSEPDEDDTAKTGRMAPRPADAGSAEVSQSV